MLITLEYFVKKKSRKQACDWQFTLKSLDQGCAVCLQCSGAIKSLDQGCAVCLRCSGAIKSLDQGCAFCLRCSGAIKSLDQGCAVCLRCSGAIKSLDQGCAVCLRCSGAIKSLDQGCALCLRCSRAIEFQTGGLLSIGILSRKYSYHIFTAKSNKQHIKDGGPYQTKRLSLMKIKVINAAVLLRYVSSDQIL